MNGYNSKLPYIVLRRAVLAFSAAGLKLDPSYYFHKYARGFAVRSVNGFKMYLDLKNDTGISKDLFTFGKREVLSTDLVTSGKVLDKGDTVLDIGANIGYYALLESRIVGPTGRVLAIEPVENNFNLLRKNISLNGITNIETFQLAAGSKNGVSEIYVARKGNVSSFIYRDDVDFISKQRIEIVTVDDFCRDHEIIPTLIRMDVEGFETEIIRGMRETLKNKPKLLIEVHPHLIKKEDLLTMFDAIISTGYKKATVIKERNELWMTRKTQVRPSLIWLSKKIGIENSKLGMGEIRDTTLEDVRSSLSVRGSAFHVLLS